MILANAITNGFQNQIPQKIYDFWGHIHISDGYTNKFFETNPIRLDSAVIEEIKYLDLRDQGAVSTVRSVNGIIQYPVIIQHGSTLEGVITRALDSDFRYDVIDQYIVDGSLDTFRNMERSLIFSCNILRKFDDHILYVMRLFFIMIC